MGSNQALNPELRNIIKWLKGNSRISNQSEIADLLQIDYSRFSKYVNGKELFPERHRKRLELIYELEYVSFQQEIPIPKPVSKLDFQEFSVTSGFQFMEMLKIINTKADLSNKEMKKTNKKIDQLNKEVDELRTEIRKKK